MDIMIITVIVGFFALVGVTNLLLGLHRWLSRTGALTDAVLVVSLPDRADTAEAVLQEAADRVDLERGLRGIRLAVVCPEQSAAREIGELFCRERGVMLAVDWQELGSLL